jgi:peptide/nickel transport system substrate-binding protein
VVYKIKPETVWSDGTPISADDFAYAFRARNTRDCPKCATSSNSGYDVLESVVGSDNGKTVTATFRAGQTYPDWKQLFGQRSIRQRGVRPNRHRMPIAAVSSPVAGHL